MKVIILSSKRKIYEGISKQVTLPGQDGQMQILEGHANIFALLSEGDVIIGESKKIPIFSGVVEILNNNVYILAKE